MHRAPLFFPSLILLAAIFLCGAAVARAGFPEPAQLPSHPELPDPLVMFNGERVANRQQWFEKRRPELKALFQHYMYGYMAKAPVKIRTVVERVDPRFLDGKATKKEVTIFFGAPEAPRLHMLLVVPNHRKGPAPVFLGLNFQGNHTVVKDRSVALPTSWVPGNFKGVKDHRATEAGRGAQARVWSVEQVIDGGYALATIYCGDIAPDDPKVREGVRYYYLKKGQAEPGPDAWGNIIAWAWGLSRGIDYLVTDKDIDKDRIAVVGHSRLGKAAIVAAAFDERVALAIPHQAGCGGTAPSRGKVGESVKQINDHFPHWFDAEFKKFNTQPDRLPFDQNCLVALVAPRPVLFTNGTEDTWANPRGQFEVLKAASPVYRFLGVEGLEARQMPKENRLIASRLGYHIRPGKHSMGPEDWKVWLEYADKWLAKSRNGK